MVIFGILGVLIIIVCIGGCFKAIEEEKKEKEQLALQEKKRQVEMLELERRERLAEMPIATAYREDNFIEMLDRDAKRRAADMHNDKLNIT